jgi:hypothetical protein
MGEKIVWDWEIDLVNLHTGVAMFENENTFKNYKASFLITSV